MHTSARERERDRERGKEIYIYTHTYTHTQKDEIRRNVERDGKERNSLHVCCAGVLVCLRESVRARVRREESLEALATLSAVHGA